MGPSYLVPGREGQGTSIGGAIFDKGVGTPPRSVSGGRLPRAHFRRPRTFVLASQALARDPRLPPQEGPRSPSAVSTAFVDSGSAMSVRGEQSRLGSQICL